MGYVDLFPAISGIDQQTHQAPKLMYLRVQPQVPLDAKFWPVFDLLLQRQSLSVYFCSRWVMKLGNTLPQLGKAANTVFGCMP